MFNGDALLILSFEGVSKEADSKVHGRGPHAVSVRPFVGIMLTNLGNSQRTVTPS